MAESSSEGSADEEEVFRNFDLEAKLIVQNDTLPKKSRCRYLLNYNNYKTWQMKNKESLSNSHENNLIVYFTELKKKLSPPTLWSIWSMLRKTLSTEEDINISNFLNLKALIKNNAKGYKPKKAYTLKWNEIMTFMKTTPDYTYLAVKVMLIVGICGAMRCCEISNLKVTDVEDLGNRFLISINDTKNDYSSQFIVGKLFYSIVKKYITLRPNDYGSDRLFVRYENGKCMRQEIGRHTVGKTPERVASYLNLENKHRYTGHCFRRTAATLASESGASIQMIKQMGRWRSDAIAQGYIENSLNNRQMIFNYITHEAAQQKPSTSAQMENAQTTHEAALQKPSTDAQLTITEKEGELDFDLNWSDFEDEPAIDKFNSILDGTVQSNYITASNKKLLSSPINNSKTASNKPFMTKPPVKIIFNNKLAEAHKINGHIAQSKVNINNGVAQSPKVNVRVTDDAFIESPSNKTRKVLEKLDENQNYQTNSVLSNQGIKFEQNTFNNCVFNITYKCHDENKP